MTAQDSFKAIAEQTLRYWEHTYAQKAEVLSFWENTPAPLVKERLGEFRPNPECPETWLCEVYSHICNHCPLKQECDNGNPLERAAEGDKASIAILIQAIQEA